MASIKSSSSINLVNINKPHRNSKKCQTSDHHSLIIQTSSFQRTCFGASLCLFLVCFFLTQSSADHASSSSSQSHSAHKFVHKDSFTSSASNHHHQSHPKVTSSSANARANSNSATAHNSHSSQQQSINSNNNVSLPTIDGQFKTLQSLISPHSDSPSHDPKSFQGSENAASSSSATPTSTTSHQTVIPNSCAAPEVLVNGAPSADIAGTVSGGDFTSISEIQFVGVVSGGQSDEGGPNSVPLKQKRICKIKCLNGVWIGPLCALQNAEQFEPILRPCKAPTIPNATLLQISPLAEEQSSSESEPPISDEQKHHAHHQEHEESGARGQLLPHGAIIAVRCREPGLYKLSGPEELHCVDGLWSASLPTCTPTTIHQNFSITSPPTILYSLLDGTLGVDERGRLVVLPGANLHLDCLFQRIGGQPHWSVSDSNDPTQDAPESSTHHRSSADKHPLSAAASHHLDSRDHLVPDNNLQLDGKRTHTTGWAIRDEENSWKYRLAMYYATAADSGRYTCHTPNGLHNSIDIRVKEVECSPIDSLISSSSKSTNPDPNRVMSVEGHRMHDRIRFSCVSGYQLIGAGEIRCQPSGKWSHSVPHCKEILCAEIDQQQLDPKLLITGLAKQTQTELSDTQESSSGIRRATLGTKVSFRCPVGYRLKGARSVHCTRQSLWSEPFPTCEQITCPEPSAPEQGHVQDATGHYLIGDYVEFGCSPGHVLVGVAVASCGHDGHWSAAPPQCKPVCEFPTPALENGYIQPVKFTYEYGEQIQLYCDQGYRMQKPDSSDAEEIQEQQIMATLTCQRSGQWSDQMPKCSRLPV